MREPSEGLSNMGLSNEGLTVLFFNFCRPRVDTPTGGLDVPCVLDFVGKKNIINIPDLLTKISGNYHKI